MIYFNVILSLANIFINLIKKIFCIVYLQASLHRDIINLLNLNIY